MDIARTVRPNRQMADVKIWLCRGCGVVHMSIGEKILNFNSEEFTNFAEAVNDIQSAQWLSPGSASSILELVAHQSDAVH